jgi:hypothetical protein
LRKEKKERSTANQTQRHIEFGPELFKDAQIKTTINILDMALAELHSAPNGGNLKIS